jgi:hypothetical protein
MKYAFVTIGAFLILFSCTKDKGMLPVMADTPPPPAGSVDTCSQNIKYSHDIAPIINNSCALPTCHVPSGYKDMSTYAALKAEIDSYTSSLYISRIKPGGGMPQTGPALTSCQISKIEAWIADGYPNN